MRVSQCKIRKKKNVFNIFVKYIYKIKSTSAIIHLYYSIRKYITTVLYSEIKSYITETPYNNTNIF